MTEPVLPDDLLNWQAKSPWRIASDKSTTLGDLQHSPTQGVEKKQCRDQLESAQQRLREEHKKLQAGGQHSVLAIFQAYDAAGKDGTIRRALYKLDPAAVAVHAFKKPTELEIRHDFLWRCARKLPPLGTLTAFNRSYYEEVLTVRVNPGFLRGQFPGHDLDLTRLWQERFAAINAFERHLVASGTRVVKFWLHVSPDEQRQRFLDRLDEPDKRWKFNPYDLKVAEQRSEYDRALVDMLNATSTQHAPWFVIPADNKPYMRWQCTELLATALSDLQLDYPDPKPEIRENEAAFRQQLQPG